MIQDLGRIAVIHRGEWASGQSYEKLDVVSLGGSSYMCIADSATSKPPSGDWRTLALKGDAFTYADFTPGEIEVLQKPATDAAEKANEAIGKVDEEHQKLKALDDEYTDAIAAEKKQQEQQKTDFETSTKNANDAATKANTAAKRAEDAADSVNYAKDAATKAAKKANVAADAASGAASRADTSAGNAESATKSATDAAADARKAAEEALGSVSGDKKFYFKRVTDENGDTWPVIVDMTVEG